MYSSVFNPYERQAEALRAARLRSMSNLRSQRPVSSQAKEYSPAKAEPEPTNVMEMLVTTETVRQVQNLPPHVQDFIKISQIKAYALNGLPPLYVTSEKGWNRYWDKGQGELRCKIERAVRQGIAAVQRDPLREISVLPGERQPIAETTLRQIKRLLGNESLTWYTVFPALKQALHDAQQSSPKLAVQKIGPKPSVALDSQPESAGSKQA